MSDNHGNPNDSADDMSEYRQIYLDETQEQLDDLVETLLALESSPDSADNLNEAFRLIHSMKGSAGMMGFDNITVLTHQLENRFERFRSGIARLDQPTMNLVLRCIDFLRECNERLRAGSELGSSGELLDEVRALEEQAVKSSEGLEKSKGIELNKTTEAEASTAEPTDPDSLLNTDQLDTSVADSVTDLRQRDNECRLIIRFESGLELADLKAQLIVSRLSRMGDIKSSRPAINALEDTESLLHFEVVINTQRSEEEIRSAADVDGVEAVEFAVVEMGKTTEIQETIASVKPDPVEGHMLNVDESAIQPDTSAVGEPAAARQDLANDAIALPADSEPTSEPTSPQLDRAGPETVKTVRQDSSPTTETSKARIVETMRIDIDRLDSLMNLAGELVVNRARFVQVSDELTPALKKAATTNNVREFSESLRRSIETFEYSGNEDGACSIPIYELRRGLELMQEQTELWDNSRRCFGQINEAIDQLTRVSDSLQRGVLETRMVPVAPLFNRFKRVVRDLSTERGKKVNLRISGDNTELDKRMIDGLGDPLMHLVRNSIDHGLESCDERVVRGKPETGTIFLEASHSGNNVFIRVRDDGCGIDCEKIKTKLVEKELLSPAAVEELSSEQVIDYIWHPGFSTAEQITDISGRGVGMDVVKTRIADLNGTIDVDSTPEQGTTFEIRLPLTLAIISSLLVRINEVFFSIPIEDVREIVSVMPDEIVTVDGKQTFDVRGEYILLVGVDDIFEWHGVRYDYGGGEQGQLFGRDDGSVNVVVLQAGGKTLGLRVDELLGSQDIVIKSLSENFVNIRGLSGASILGDGTVCLMLDVGMVVKTVVTSAGGSTANKEFQIGGPK